MSHTLFISVEKVPPTNSGMILLGVSLTVLPDSPPLNSELARPWKWKNLSWLVWGSPDGTTWTPMAAAQISQMPVPAIDKPATPDPWCEILETAIAQITNWPLGTPAPTTKIVLKDDGKTPGEHQYLSLLNNMAAGPYPVPQNLNLSFFLELKGIPANFTQFLAAPSFSADGATIQPAANVTIPASDSMWDVTGSTTMKMLAWFSDPEKDFASLWIKPPVRNGDVSLVSDWTAHLYDLIGPCLDLPHVIFNMDKSKLKALLPENSPDWPEFRRWMTAGLYDLVVSRLPVAGVAPSMDMWVDLLKTTLKDSLENFPDLTLNAPLPQSFDVGIAELMKIISTATAGKKLVELMKAFYGKQLQGIPRSLLQEDDNGALLRWLEVGLALPYAKQIADACAKTPEDYDAISKALGQAVISPSLAQVPTLLADTTLPPVFQSIAKACVADLQKDLMKALSLRAKGDDGSSWPATSNAPPLVIPVMEIKSNDGQPTDPLHGIRGAGVLMRRQATSAMDWKCPNIVAAVGDPSRPLLVASRLGYNQKLLTGFLFYDNGPIPCANLLHNYLPKADRLGSAEKSPINPVFQYAPYEGTDLSLYGTPTLECGELFEIVCFAVSNAGALPVELRDGYPAKFKALAKGALLPGETTAQPSPLLQAIRYFRTVPVGAIETRDAKGMQVVDSAGVFPRNPANVWPRSIETVVPKIGVKLQMAGGDLTPAKPSTLLVVPGESNKKKRAYGTAQHFEFSLNLPLIEPLTWDRTVGYQKDSILRAQILDTAYNKLAVKKASDITDPLITHVDVNLYRWDMISGPGKWTGLPGTVTFPVDALRKAATGVNSVQTFPIRISIDAGSGKDDGSVKLAAISGSGSSSVQDLAVSLAESEVYLLEATFRLDGSVSTIMRDYPQAVTGVSVAHRDCLCQDAVASRFEHLFLNIRQRREQRSRSKSYRGVKY